MCCVYNLIVVVYWSAFLDHSVFAHKLGFCALSLWARKLLLLYVRMGL